MKKHLERALEMFEADWAILSAGTLDDYNAMTIGWGALGSLWSKPCASVFVKPIRHTHSYMEKNDYFTVSFFDKKYLNALKIFGTKSGRDHNKAELAGLNAAAFGQSVGFMEASVTLLCKKLYSHDFELEKVPADVNKKYYLVEEPHTVYWGEVIGVFENENA